MLFLVSYGFPHDGPTREPVLMVFCLWSFYLFIPLFIFTVASCTEVILEFGDLDWNLADGLDVWGLVLQ